MGESAIEWTDRTWNPVRGCSRVSEGCRNCYAERQAVRFARSGVEGNVITGRGTGPFYGFAKSTPAGPRWTGRVELVPKMLDEPLRWRDATPKLGRPLRVFVNSMSDLFHEALSNEDIERVFARMALARQHTFQVLTKRPARMLDWFRTGVPGIETREEDVASVAAHAGGIVWDGRGAEKHLYPPGCGDVSNRRAWPGWPLPNVWLGVSVEDQRTADERIPFLLETPAAVRFVSYEPTLGPVDFTALNIISQKPADWPRVRLDALRGHVEGPDDMLDAHLDWVIVGGESGPGARPCDIAWARSVVRQCREAGVRVFVKQMGSNVRTRNDSVSTERDPDVPTDWPEPPEGWGRIAEDLDGYRDGYQGAPIRIHLKSPKGGDPAEWPEDIRVREFPR